MITLANKQCISIASSEKRFHMWVYVRWKNQSTNTWWWEKTFCVHTTHYTIHTYTPKMEQNISCLKKKENVSQEKRPQRNKRTNKKNGKKSKKKIINKQKFSTSFKSFLLCRTEIESQPNKKKRNWKKKVRFSPSHQYTHHAQNIYRRTIYI